MNNSLTGFIYRGLAPYKFTPLPVVPEFNPRNRRWWRVIAGVGID